ncbi:hypothetical protein PV327_005648 [Microctonus hyperodae]|uniref:Uncharacterized protein n=1 Tax=Microctonus hyperodae TaxID=165561 RepID=A0AA39G1T5_MICHY|nr:hypothetical protein PV327_005648 [Microctonus hyperodae]
MSEDESPTTKVNFSRKVILTNINGRSFEFSLEDVVSGYAVLETEAVPGPSRDAPIPVDIPENRQGIAIEPANLERLRRDGPTVENIHSVNTPPTTPDRNENVEKAQDSDLESSISIENSEEIPLECENNVDNQSPTPGPSGVPPNDRNYDSGDEDPIDIENLIREELYVPHMISPIALTYADLASFLPSPDPSSSSGRQSDLNINNAGSPAYRSGSDQRVDEDESEDINYDDPGSPIPALSPQEIPLDDVNEKHDSDNSNSPTRPSGSHQFFQYVNEEHNYISSISASGSQEISLENVRLISNSDDSDIPIHSSGARDYSAEGAKPKYKIDNSDSLIRPSCSRDFNQEETNNNYNENFDNSSRASSSRQFSTGETKRKHSPDQSDSSSDLGKSPVNDRRVPSIEDSTISYPSTPQRSPTKVRKTNFMGPIYLPDDYNQPSTSGMSSSSHQYSPQRENDNAQDNVSHSFNLPIVHLRHLHPPNPNNQQSFRNCPRVWADAVFVRNNERFRFTFRRLENYGRQRILTFMAAYYRKNNSTLFPSCVNTNGASLMNMVWDLAVSMYLSVGVFLDNGEDEDLQLVGVDILLLMQMMLDHGSHLTEDMRHLFGFLCIHPQYRGFGLGKILMEIRSQTERDLDLTSPDSGQGEKIIDNCLYDEEEEEDKEEKKDKEEEKTK